MEPQWTSDGHLTETLMETPKRDPQWRPPGPPKDPQQTLDQLSTDPHQQTPNQHPTDTHRNAKINSQFTLVLKTLPERYTSPSKEAGLVIYLAFLAKVVNLYYMILTAFKKYWPDTVAKFTSGTQDRFI